MMDKLKHYLLLMRVHKPIGFFLLLWPTLWALWIAAKGKPNGVIFGIFVMGIILMRSAGCVINDYADRHFDDKVKRTQFRPIVSGKISPKEAIILFIILSIIAFSLVLFLNALTISLSVVAIALVALYPFMKRFIHWPQFILGLAFSWGIPMAFAAEKNHIPGIAWLLFATAVLWTLIYDTEYAMVDRSDDIKIGIKSTAILFGNHDIWIIVLLHMIVLALFVLIGIFLSFSFWYFGGVAIAALLALYQQFLIRDREPRQCFKAFLNNHWFGMAIFFGIFMNYCFPVIHH